MNLMVPVNSMLKRVYGQKKKLGYVENCIIRASLFLLFIKYSYYNFHLNQGCGANRGHQH
jgi:hypothetical protein